jgi:hypothetical protein
MKLRSKYRKYILTCHHQNAIIQCRVQKMLSSSLLSQNVKIRIYKLIILPVVMYGCETSSLTLRNID